MAICEHRVLDASEAAATLSSPRPAVALVSRVVVNSAHDAVVAPLASVNMQISASVFADSVHQRPKEEDLVSPWSWRSDPPIPSVLQGERVSTFEARGANGNLICPLPGLGPNTRGADLQDMIALADGIPRTEKRIVLDNRDIAVYDRLSDFNSGMQVLTIVYESLVSRLCSENAIIREQANWMIAKATEEELIGFVTQKTMNVLVSNLSLECAETREISGGVQAIKHIIETFAKMQGNHGLDLLKAAGAKEALNSVMSAPLNSKFFDLTASAFSLLNDYFGGPSSGCSDSSVCSDGYFADAEDMPSPIDCSMW